MDKEEVRLYLQQTLEATFSDLSVIYRPSGNHELTHPCIVYEPKAEEPVYASNQTYAVGTRFQVTILSKLPGYSDSRKMLTLGPQGIVCLTNRTYTAEDIVHDVFIVSVHTI